MFVCTKTIFKLIIRKKTTLVPQVSFLNKHVSNGTNMNDSDERDNKSYEFTDLKRSVEMFETCMRSFEEEPIASPVYQNARRQARQDHAVSVKMLQNRGIKMLFWDKWREVDVSEITVWNAQDDNKRLLRFDIDRLLAQYFPIIGCGTEALVFGGTDFVIKRRVTQGRVWECDLNLFARQFPGMKLKEYSLYLEEDNNLYGDYDLLVQERTRPVWHMSDEIKAQIRATWGANNPHASQLHTIGEWGYTSDRLYHIFDWD